MHDVQAYIDDARDGRRLCGKKELLAIERFENLKNHPDYYFDHEAVERVFKISRYFKHTSGDYAGKPFTLLPWQKFSIANLFGIKKKSTGRRLFRKAYFGVSKKNGKTEFAAFLGVYFTFFDGEKAAEVYSAANKYDQATFSWEAGAIMCEMLKDDEDDTFGKICKISNSVNSRKITNLSNKSKFMPIASDSKTLDGIKASAAIIDEFHEAKDDSLLRNVSSSMVNRSAPMLIIITTSGFNLYGECKRYEKVCTDILEGKKQDDTTFALIFQMDRGDDWKDKKMWYKSNPSLGVTPTMEGLEVEFQKALIEGATAEVAFKTKNLNQWVQSEMTWIPFEKWQANQYPFVYNQLIGRQCFMAWDLSSTSDLSCVGLLFPPVANDDQFVFYCEFFIPKDVAQLRARRDQVPYLEWEKTGLISYTNGDTIDYEFIQVRVQQMFSDFDVESIAHDEWQSANFAQTLVKNGIDEDKIRAFRQTVTLFNEPIKTIETWIKKGQLNHGSNEIILWMSGNVILEQNATGLIKFNKKKSQDKIDGLVTLAMCVGEYLDYMNDDRRNIYESHGIRYV